MKKFVSNLLGTDSTPTAVITAVNLTDRVIIDLLAEILLDQVQKDVDFERFLSKAKKFVDDEDYGDVFEVSAKASRLVFQLDEKGDPRLVRYKTLSNRVLWFERITKDDATHWEDELGLSLEPNTWVMVAMLGESVIFAEQIERHLQTEGFSVSVSSVSSIAIGAMFT